MAYRKTIGLNPDITEEDLDKILKLIHAIYHINAGCDKERDLGKILYVIKRLVNDLVSEFEVR